MIRVHRSDHPDVHGSSQLQRVTSIEMIWLEANPRLDPYSTDEQLSTPLTATSRTAACGPESASRSLTPRKSVGKSPHAS